MGRKELVVLPSFLDGLGKGPRQGVWLRCHPKGPSAHTWGASSRFLPLWAAPCNSPPPWARPTEPAARPLIPLEREGGLFSPSKA